MSKIVVEVTSGSDQQIKGVLTLEYRWLVPGNDPWSTMLTVFGPSSGEWFHSKIAGILRVRLFGAHNGKRTHVMDLDVFGDPDDASTDWSGSGDFKLTGAKFPSGSLTWRVIDVY